MLELWQEKANPFMQGLHFSYALGLTIAPLISEPFLSKEIKNQTSNSASQSVEQQMDSEFFQSFLETSGDLDEGAHLNKTMHTETRIYIPYGISALMMFVSAILLFAMSFIVPYIEQKRQSSGSRDPGDATQSSSTSKEDLDDKTQESTDKRYLDYKYLIVLGNFLMCFYTGVELNAFAFLPDFAVYSQMRLSKSTGAYMASVMSAAFAAFRGLSIPVATKLSSERMLHLHFLIVCLGNGLLVVAGLIPSVPLTWVAIVIMGIGMSCMLSTIYSYVEERIVVTNRLTGLFIFSSASSTVLYLTFLGIFIKKYPMIFVYVNILSLLITLAVFIGLFFIEHRHRKSIQTGHKMCL